MSLRSFSDNALLSRTRKLVRHERMCMVHVLSHLNEIEGRKLHFDLGYRSMLHFCVEALGYARSSAGRRIMAARCVKRFPEVLGMLAANEANVVTIACVAGILTPENKDEILGRIRGKTQEEVEAVVVSYRPCEARRDRVREVLMPRPVATAVLPAMTMQAVATKPAQAPAGEQAQHANTLPARGQSHCETECKDSRGETTGESAQPEFERRVILDFTVSKEFMAKLGRFRSLMWHRLPANATMEQVFGLMMDQVLEQKDPAARRARRQEREKSNKNAPNGAAPLERPQQSKSNPRHIPARVRDEVFVRDKGRCSFVGRTGRKCQSTTGLQVDHIVPVAHGGKATLSNLRLLCAWHNRLEAERILGKAAASRAVRPPRELDNQSAC